MTAKNFLLGLTLVSATASFCPEGMDVWDCHKFQKNFVPPPPTSAPPPTASRGHYIQFDGDCHGNDIRIEFTPLASCVSACDKDSRCKGVSFNPRENRCVLKSATCNDPDRQASHTFYEKEAMLWPEGRYCFPTVSLNQCPTGFNAIERYQDTEDSNPNSFSTGTVPGYVPSGKTGVFTYFCCTDIQAGARWGTSSVQSASVQFPPGSYCISSANCPRGFQSGWRSQADELTDNENGISDSGVHHGIVAGDKTTTLYTCCRTDGDASQPIEWPVQAVGFSLFRKGGSCQRIAGYRVTEGSIRFDDEDTLDPEMAAYPAPPGNRVQWVANNRGLWMGSLPDGRYDGDTDTIYQYCNYYSLS